MKIIVDGFGGDNAPSEIVKGIVQAINENKGFSIIVTGKEEILAAELSKYSYDKTRVEILNCTEVITNDDVPTSAIRTKPDSSLVTAMKKIKEDGEAAGLVSAGSTGAVLAGGLMKVGRIKGISRPALCPILPTVIDGKNVLLVDCGANVDSKPVNLCHFAIMGSSYSTAAFGVEKPKVALLSNGTEEKKGNDLNHEAYPLLKSMKCINFIGNIEAREILSGEADVVVTDGFAGNIALKGIEGAIVSLLKIMKNSIMKSMRGKIGALFLKPVFKEIKNKMDYNSNGGAVFIGTEKIIVKSHGSSKAQSIACSIMQVKSAYENNLVGRIKEKLLSLELPKASQENADA